MTAHIPHRKLEALAQWFQALAATIPPADDTASATLYRSEIALVVLALDTLAAGQSFGTAMDAVGRNAHQRPSLGDWVTPWNGHQDEPALGYMTEEDLLKGLEGLIGEPDIIRTYDPTSHIGINGRMLMPEDIDHATGPLVVTRHLTPEEKQLRDRLASTRPKEYGAGKLGPVPVPPPSVSLSAKPSCSPRFGIADSRLNTDSGNGTDSAEAALHTAHNEGVREGSGLG